MWRIVAITPLVLCVLSAPAASQELTLDEVLDTSYEAVGGLDAWKAVRSMKITGNMSMRGGTMQVPFTRYVERPDKIRVEFSMQGMTANSKEDER